jgi:hypothetical protein
LTVWQHFHLPLQLVQPNSERTAELLKTVNQIASLLWRWRSVDSPAWIDLAVPVLSGRYGLRLPRLADAIPCGEARGVHWVARRATRLPAHRDRDRHVSGTALGPRTIFAPDGQQVVNAPFNAVHVRLNNPPGIENLYPNGIYAIPGRHAWNNATGNRLWTTAGNWSPNGPPVQRLTGRRSHSALRTGSLLQCLMNQRYSYRHLKCFGHID